MSILSARLVVTAVSLLALGWPSVQIQVQAPAAAQTPALPS